MKQPDAVNGATPEQILGIGAALRVVPGWAARGICLALGVTLISGLPAPAMAACPPQATTTVAMKECAADELAVADRELNQIYAQIKARLQPRVMTQTRDAQRKWVSFRDAACDAEGLLYEGGSLQGLVITNCLTRLTRERTQHLRQLLPN